MWVRDVWLFGSLAQSVSKSGLSGNTTYYAKSRLNSDWKSPTTGGWSSALTVKTGVVPANLSSSPDSTSIGFSWDSNANASGYKVDATKVLASTAWETKSLSDKTYTMNTLGSGDEWYYERTKRTGAGGTVTEAPKFYTYANTSTCYGHHLGGTPGNALVSKAFPVAGATGMSIEVKVGAWNLNLTQTSLENGRIAVYYSLDSGPWRYIGTGLPSAAGDGNVNTVTFTVPQGGLDGENIAFKIAAPNASEGTYGSTSPTLRFAGPFIRSVTITRTPGAGGHYGTSSLAGYPKTVTTASDTVTGLTTGERVYFRVQALQGSDTANPDARSV